MQIPHFPCAPVDLCNVVFRASLCIRSQKKEERHLPWGRKGYTPFIHIRISYIYTCTYVDTLPQLTSHRPAETRHWTCLLLQPKPLELSDLRREIPKKWTCATSETKPLWSCPTLNTQHWKTCWSHPAGTQNHWSCPTFTSALLMASNTPLSSSMMGASSAALAAAARLSASKMACWWAITAASASLYHGSLSTYGGSHEARLCETPQGHPYHQNCGPHVIYLGCPEALIVFSMRWSYLRMVRSFWGCIGLEWIVYETFMGDPRQTCDRVTINGRPGLHMATSLSCYTLSGMN